MTCENYLIKCRQSVDNRYKILSSTARKQRQPTKENEMNRYDALNAKADRAEDGLKKTNHILHLLLCIPTMGLWLLVWVISAAYTSHQNTYIMKEVNKLRDKADEELEKCSTI